MFAQEMTGSEALAYGAMESGVQFVTGYPGSPATGVVEALLRLNDGSVRIEWGVNEKAAFEAAFGASLAGVRSLLCIKSVGLNIALDALMVGNLAGGEGGFVIVVGDDPGGWGSQNEEDSRPLVAAAEVPLLEPIHAGQARPVMHRAFDISEKFRVPVVVRLTRALAENRTARPEAPPTIPPRPQADFQPQPERYNVLPVRVVELHRQLQTNMSRVRTIFEHSKLNVEEGTAPRGVLVAGQVADKLYQVLGGSRADALRILQLSTLNPLPTSRIAVFLRQVDSVLVLEEVQPYVETQVLAIAQRAGLTLPIYGRFTGHVPGAGELFAPHVALALTALLPDWTLPPFQRTHRAMPSREPLCEGCPYIPTLEALQALMQDHGGRKSFVVTGEAGCMVRAQLPPWEILDVKYGLGASIGLAAGLARTGIPQHIVALAGDSALLHSGLGGLIDAVQAGVRLLVIVLDNGTTALSGKQPHPASGYDVQGHPRPAVDLAALVRAAGVDTVRVVDAFDAGAVRSALEEGLAAEDVAVVIAKGDCPYAPGMNEDVARG